MLLSLYRQGQSDLKRLGNNQGHRAECGCSLGRHTVFPKVWKQEKGEWTPQDPTTGPSQGLTGTRVLVSGSSTECQVCLFRLKLQLCCLLNTPNLEKGQESRAEGDPEWGGTFQSHQSSDMDSQYPPRTYPDLHPTVILSSPPLLGQSSRLPPGPLPVSSASGDSR